jgi:hypothetical protein
MSPKGDGIAVTVVSYDRADYMEMSVGTERSRNGVEHQNTSSLQHAQGPGLQPIDFLNYLCWIGNTLRLIDLG